MRNIKMNFIKKATIIALTTGLGISAAVNAATDTGTASVTLQTPVSIDSVTDVAFGTITNNGGTATCTMDAAGALSSAESICTGTGTLGAVNVSGTASANVDVTLTTGAAVDGVTFTPQLADGSQSGTSAIDGAGALSIPVQGTINYSGAQTDGAKNLTYTVAVNYN
jgi:Flp pilus assembly protein TadG